MALSGLELINACRTRLDELWQEVKAEYENAPDNNYDLDETLRGAIHRSINSGTKSYRYVLPTQLLAKVVEPAVDCQCLQEQRGGVGAFDARSLAHSVIVTFDEANNKVLGGAPEPYVNNPLRVPEVSAKHRDKRKDKEGWDDLLTVLSDAQQDATNQTALLSLKQVLLEILRRLHQTTITYSVPSRTSLEQTRQVAAKFMSIPSGGDNVQAIATGLLKAVGLTFGIFDRVERSHTNAADASTGQVADIECYKADTIVLAAEVKYVALTKNMIEVKLPVFRSNGVTEIVYLITKGLVEAERAGIEALMSKEFANGQNIYLYDLGDFAAITLGLLGEDGRRVFLVEVGKTLEAFNSPYKQRKAWAELLASI